MIIRQKINYGTIQKVCQNGIFIPFTCVTPSEFYFITSPVLFTESNKLRIERKYDFLYVWVLQRIKLYQRR